MSAETTCIKYFTQFTQAELPIRLLNGVGPEASDAGSPYNPCDTWNCTDEATEYDCLGIDYTLASDGTVASANYKSFKDLKQYWSDTGGGCVNLFKSIVQGLNTTNISAFSRTGFQFVQDDFTFLLTRYFNQDPTTETNAGTGKTTVIPLVPGSAIPAYPTIYKNTWIGASYNLTSSGLPGYDSFLDTLLDACQQIPGACNPVQQTMCLNCTRQEIIITNATTKIAPNTSNVHQGYTIGGPKAPDLSNKDLLKVC